MDIEKICSETISEMNSKINKNGDSTDIFVEQLIKISANTTKIMLMKYHEELLKELNDSNK